MPTPKHDPDFSGSIVGKRKKKMTKEKASAVKVAIETIDQRAATLRLLYDKKDIAVIEDCGFSFVMLKNYFDLSDISSPGAYFASSALEVHYIHPKAFDNAKHCGDPILREMLERGYTEDEIIPQLGVVIRVVVRCAALFAVITPDGDEVMFGNDKNTSVLQQYQQARGKRGLPAFEDGESS